MDKAPCEISFTRIRIEKSGHQDVFIPLAEEYGGVWGPFKELYFEWIERMTLTLSLVHQFPPAGVCLGEQGSTQNSEQLSNPNFIISIFYPQSIT